MSIDSNMNKQSTFKVVLVGDTSVGKTSIVNRAANDVFNIAEDSTVGVDFCVIEEIVQNIDVTLHVFDTAGQERYRSIGTAYYQNATVALVVYSIEQRNSLNSVDQWINDVSDVNHKIKIFLVGNKIDLYGEQSADELITKSEGEDKGKSLNIPFFAVSAQSGEGIHELFQSIAEACLGLGKEEIESKRIEGEIKRDNKGCC